jgi:hypothetical protein
MRQRGNIGTFWVAPLHGLLKLLRSPRRTMLFAACDAANTFASDICAASSMNSVSTDSNAFARAHNQAVPPPT